MHQISYPNLVLLALCPLAVKALNTDAFSFPEAKYRPKFRYWLPDASVPSTIVQQDIASVAEIGGGGIELLPFYNYGCPSCDDGIPTPTDWSIYGFGMEAYHEILKAALEATRDNKLLLDFAQGASQGQGCPAEPESPGLAVELTYVNVTIGAGKSFNGTLPFSTQPKDHSGGFMHKLEEFGKQKLFAVTAAEVLSTTDVIVCDQIVDLTSEVTADRSLSWTSPEGNSTWRIFAWYERYTNQRSVAAGPNATNYIQNGSWVVDHFSAQGAQLLTDFFDENVIVDDQTAELLASVGEYAWEDSMEMGSALWWTPGFQDTFYERHGYNITRCLPLLIGTANGWAQTTLPYDEAFVAVNFTFQEGCNEDYRTVLNDGYQKYLSYFKSWAHSRGFEYSAQTAYNLPIDMLADVPLVDAPEGESFGFNDNIDLYRQFSGPAHIAGVPVVSSECGAVRGAPFHQTINDLLWSVRQGLAGGISMNVFHGFAYSGPYPNTTWPTWTVMSYVFTEMWNSHQPAWRHMNSSMDYVARNQYISQAGTPKVDLAFYQYSAPWTFTTSYQSSKLEALGYTYDYLSPALLENAVVKDSLLAPHGPAYKALIFSNQTLISPQAAIKVQEFVAAGLPIFFIGANTNFTGIGLREKQAGTAARTMRDLISSGVDNIHTVPSAEELPAALAGAGIHPQVSFADGTSDWHSFWREQDDFSHMFLYNNGNSTHTSEVTIAITAATPYIFDAWTGTISPILHYTATTTHITLPITLAANQTTIIGFATSNTTAGLSAPEVHVTASSGTLAGLTYADGNIFAQLAGPSATLTLSNGTTRTVAASPPPASTLMSWNISIEDWHSTDDIFSLDTAIDVHSYTNTALASWIAIDPALVGVSGVGTYRASFAHPATATTDALGAILHLGPVTNTIKARLNGELLPPIDISNAVLDVSDYLRMGVNELEVEVTTTLFNRIKADADRVWTSGLAANVANGGYYKANPAKEYGLLGPVSVEWVDLVQVV